MNLPTTPTDKPATINTRSDAASANEMATAVAATVSENAGSDTVLGGSIPAANVPAWKLMCVIVEGKDRATDNQPKDNRWCSVLSPTREYYWCGAYKEWRRASSSHCAGQIYIGVRNASEALAACTTPPPDWPTPAHTDDPREEPERFCEATGPVETVTYSDPSPCGTFVRKITKPAESIEKLIDRLAHIRDCHKIDWQFQIRVTGDVEKAEPRSYDSPGYPEHFALHHVYLGEDLTRAILTTIAYDLDSKGMDKPTVRKVLDSVARAFQLTAEFGETDLIGMAVAVEDKLDIGKE